MARLAFENVDPAGREPFADPASFRKANELAKTYAASPAGWLVIAGPSGVGKTHLAAAIVNHMLRNGKPAKFIFVPEFLDRLRASYGGQESQRPIGLHLDNQDRPSFEAQSSTYDDELALAATSPLLVLDDLGGQSSTPWAEEKLQQLLSFRFDNRLPAVITTRLVPDVMDDWLRSRVLDPSFTHLATIKAGAMNADLSDIGIERRMRETMKFETFDPRGGAGASSEQRERLREALKAAQSFAADPHGWLYLSGPTGAGKTHLAVAIASTRLQRKQPVLFRFVPDLMDHLRRTFSPDSATSYDRVFERIKNAELLVLDDFGAQAWTPWTEEKMYQLVVHRYNAALPTVITSQVLLNDMDDGDSPGNMRFGRRYSDAIASRLRDGSLVTECLVSAPDFRNRGTQLPAGSRAVRTRVRPVAR